MTDQDKKAVNEALDHVEKVLATQAGRELWKILTGLRGSDADRSFELKWNTAARIRAEAFPRLVLEDDVNGGTNYNGAYFNKDGKDVESFLAAPGGGVVGKSYHYSSHIILASAALQEIERRKHVAETPSAAVQT